jgi:hypothetical protein
MIRTAAIQTAAIRPLVLLLLFPALFLSLSVRADDAKDEEKEKSAKEEKPKGPLDHKPGDVVIGDPGIKIADAAVATSEIARFQADYKAARIAKDDNKRADLLLKLGEKDHPKIYKIATKIVKDKNFRVATAAVICVARQQGSAKKGGPFLQKVLKSEKRTNIRCAAIVGMGVLGYTKAFKDVRKEFRKSRTEPRKAAARYFGYTKAKEAFRLLAEELDEPRATNPNDPDNPPASVWEQRWKDWKENETAVHWALSQLVEGETFETTIEAKNWAEKSGKKHKIEW